MGEPVSIIAQKRSQHLGRRDDETIEVITKTAIVDFEAVVSTPEYAKKRNGFQSSISGSEIHVSFDTSVFASEDEYPTAGESGTVLRLDKPSRKNQRLTITWIDPDELGRIVCVCAKS